MLYGLYDLNRAALGPVRIAADATRSLFSNPLTPLAYTRVGRAVAAGADVLGGVIKTFAKPEWRIDDVVVNGRTLPVTIETVLRRPFCNLIRFHRDGAPENQPKVLIIAPMSGHYATLLRGTVLAMLPGHDVYVTDWIDARDVPLSDGPFGLDEYIAYIIAATREIGENVNIIAVCQPAPLTLAAVALMAEWRDDMQPATMTLMGGPIDPREAKTQVTELAQTHTLNWFEQSMTAAVPPYYAGAFRKVYPGFLQLSAFISMNPTRHVESHLKHFHHLVQGDGDSAEAHRKFYDEYLSVMDIPAEFYVETLDIVFKRFLIPDSRYLWRGQPVQPARIEKTALLTVEGALDDISAPGQTAAAHMICSGLASNKRAHLLQADVGHYGIFNGRRWREIIAPTIAAFIRDHDASQRQGWRRFTPRRTRGLPAPDPHIDRLAVAAE